ncbi:MAG: large conductance mechanosensitive channel protein MscL [Bryobacteraceae bacterium]
MLSEFKEFIKRGNVMDLAVAVIIGAAFGKIISSLTDDLLMPVISLFTGRIDFANLFFALDGKTYATLADAKKAGAATLAYGNFINATVYFLIVAFAVFLIVRQINRFLPAPPPPPPPGPSPEQQLLGEIRDILKQK